MSIPPPPPKPRSEPPAWYKVHPTDDGARVEFGGRFDEKTDFAPLKEQLAGAVEFDLAQVARVNSTGVRAWVDFIHALPRVRSLVFVGCSPAIVTQLNTIYNFRGPARVRSIFAPFVCESCGHEEHRLLEVAALATGVPSFDCPGCREKLLFDELPERYLSFLKDEPR